MSEQRLHTYAIVGTALVIIAMGGGGYATQAFGGSGEDAEEDPFKDMVVIDAALAEKAAAPETKQPQKETRAPTPQEKPVGVSRDENAKPITEPDKPPPPPKLDVESILEKNRDKDEDEDLPVAAKPRLEIGRIDGVEVGYGDKTYGNAYVGALKSMFLKGWDFPEILDDVGVPTGCVQLDADGKIDEVKLMKASGNAQLDDSVERALEAFKTKNNEDPKPLPTVPDDLTYLARMPLCWRMKV